MQRGAASSCTARGDSTPSPAEVPPTPPRSTLQHCSVGSFGAAAVPSSPLADQHEHPPNFRADEQLTTRHHCYPSLDNRLASNPLGTDECHWASSEDRCVQSPSKRQSASVGTAEVPLLNTSPAAVSTSKHHCVPLSSSECSQVPSSLGPLLPLDVCSITTPSAATRCHQSPWNHHATAVPAAPGHTKQAIHYVTKV
jgi:hypothetical protein